MNHLSILRVCCRASRPRVVGQARCDQISKLKYTYNINNNSLGLLPQGVESIRCISRSVKSLAWDRPQPQKAGSNAKHPPASQICPLLCADLREVPDEITHLITTTRWIHAVHDAGVELPAGRASSFRKSSTTPLNSRQSNSFATSVQRSSSPA